MRSCLYWPHCGSREHGEWFVCEEAIYTCGQVWKHLQLVLWKNYPKNSYSVCNWTESVSWRRFTFFFWGFFSSLVEKLLSNVFFCSSSHNLQPTAHLKVGHSVVFEFLTLPALALLRVFSWLFSELPCCCLLLCCDAECVWEKTSLWKVGYLGSFHWQCWSWHIWWPLKHPPQKCFYFLL